MGLTEKVLEFHRSGVKVDPVLKSANKCESNFVQSIDCNPTKPYQITEGMVVLAGRGRRVGGGNHENEGVPYQMPAQHEIMRLLSICTTPSHFCSGCCHWCLRDGRFRVCGGGDPVSGSSMCVCGSR